MLRSIAIAIATPIIFWTPVGAGQITPPATTAKASGTIDPATARAIARYDEDDPAYARLKSLVEIADTINDLDAAKKNFPAAQAALQKVVDLGLLIKVRGTHLPHPSAGRALISMSINEQAQGNHAVSLSLAERGMEIIRPFRDQFPNTSVQAISLIGYLQTFEGKPTEGAATLAQGVDFYEKRIAATPPAERNKTMWMAKSNIEFSYGQALSKLGENDRAVEAQRRSLESRITSVGENSPDAISSRYGLAMLLMKAGRVDEGETEARRAVEQATDHAPVKHPAYARSLEALGLILSRNGKRAEAVEYLRQSIEIKRTTFGTNNQNFIAGLQNLGSILVQLERYTEAKAVLAEATKGYAALEKRPSAEAIRATGYAGLAQFALGERAAAAQTMDDALNQAKARDASERDIGQQVLPSLALARLDLGEAAAARSLAATYKREVRGFADSPALLIAYADVLAAYADRDIRADWATEARAASAQAIDTVRNNRSLSQDGELPQTERAALDLTLRVAAETRDAPLALDAMTVLAGSRIAQANRLLVQRIADADPALTARVRTLQDSVKTFQLADDTLLKALATGKGVDTARTNRQAAASALRDERAGIERDFPRWVEAQGADRPDLATIRAGLRSDEAVLGVIPGYDGVYVLAITPKGTHVHRTALGRAAVVDLVVKVRDSLALGALDTAAAHRLHSQIFTPETSLLLSTTRSLRIVPTGALASLPFPVLLERPVARADRTSPYLLRRFATVVSPTFASPTRREARPATAAIARFLGVGAPTPFRNASITPAVAFASADAKPAAVQVAGRYFRGRGADSTALSSLPPLPETSAEIAAIARQFGTERATVLIGDDASERRVRSMDLTRYSILLFATHGLVSGEMEGVTEPALVLAAPASGADRDGDGLLTSSEIGTLRLDADWVILSACNTAAGDGAASTAYSGLAQAFRYAGARSLLVSHWPVRDDAATFITVQTVRIARNDERREIALQKAMLELLANRSIPDAANPYIWAPYVLVD